MPPAAEADNFRWEDYHQFKLDTLARLAQLEKQSAVEAVHRDNVEKRLSSIEDTLKWLVRLIVGGIIASILAYILQGGFTIG